MNVGYVHTLETPDNAVDRGTLRVSVIDRDTNQPVQNARVEVSYTADPESVLEVLDTDNSGLTEDVGLAAPPLEYSMEPGIEQPYAEYTVTVRAEGYEAFSVSAFRGIKPAEYADGTKTGVGITEKYCNWTAYVICGISA